MKKILLVLTIISLLTGCSNASSQDASNIGPSSTPVVATLEEATPTDTLVTSAPPASVTVSNEVSFKNMPFMDQVQETLTFIIQSNLWYQNMPFSEELIKPMCIGKPVAYAFYQMPGDSLPKEYGVIFYAPDLEKHVLSDGNEIPEDISGDYFSGRLYLSEKGPTSELFGRSYNDLKHIKEEFSVGTLLGTGTIVLPELTKPEYHQDAEKDAFNDLVKDVIINDMIRLDIMGQFEVFIRQYTLGDADIALSGASEYPGPEGILIDKTTGEISHCSITVPTSKGGGDVLFRDNYKTSIADPKVLKIIENHALHFTYPE